jgi:two-component system osmolarity sensor histidine kinase EnvZ
LKKLAKELNVKDVTVYFQFKPSPRIWIQTPEMNGNWVREPLKTYANYSPELIFGWLLAFPLLLHHYFNLGSSAESPIASFAKCCQQL